MAATARLVPTRYNSGVTSTRTPMLNWAPLFLIAAATLHASEPVTVAQLTDIVAQSSNSRDAEIARHLSALELTERISLAEFARLKVSLPGDQSKQALSALADNSAFLPPPAQQVLSDPAPPIAEQQRIAGLVVNYVVNTTHKLPNFFATRITTRLEDWPMGFQQGKMVPARYIPPHVVATAQAIVRYREGVEQSEPVRKKKKLQTEYGLTARGAFGPVLRTVLLDSAQSTLAWSRWESAGGTRAAVFRFSVPYEKSSYDVRFCCVPIDKYIFAPLDRRTAYHGEITVDPETGTILRLTLQADLDQGDLGTLFSEAADGAPISRADLAVEYAPVEIAGKTYSCPIRAVAISRARTLVQRGNSDRGFSLGPERNFINEISFSNYHVFRSESRILPSIQ